MLLEAQEGESNVSDSAGKVTPQIKHQARGKKMGKEGGGGIAASIQVAAAESQPGCQQPSGILGAPIWSLRQGLAAKFW